LFSPTLYTTGQTIHHIYKVNLDILENPTQGFSAKKLELLEEKIMKDEFPTWKKA